MKSPESDADWGEAPEAPQAHCADRIKQLLVDSTHTGGGEAPATAAFSTDGVEVPGGSTSVSQPGGGQGVRDMILKDLKAWYIDHVDDTQADAERTWKHLNNV